jgi:REP element-mobilizing transposase RayT
MSLLEPRFKKLFLFLVRKAKLKFHFYLWDFCIIENHIHLSIKPGKDGTLSKMRGLWNESRSGYLGIYTISYTGSLV